MSLEQLRGHLEELDRELLELVARRQQLAAEIGKVKRDEALPPRDWERERVVVEQARTAATELGIAPELAEELMLPLIRSSLTVQERDRVTSQQEGGGRTALVIGGGGKMGSWFTRFLASQGFAVEVADPAGAPPGFVHYSGWRDAGLRHDVIVVAAPLRATATILAELAEQGPAGVVFDIGSLKSPLRGGLEALAAAGAQVTSIHPMFGPDTELLSGRHIIYVDAGVAEATTAAKALFAPTMAIQVDMDLDGHDRLIAYVLGLAHALNIAFATALTESGEPAAALAQLSSTTFDEQLRVAGQVMSENPHLYYEIQSLNDYGSESLSALLYAVERLRSVVRAGQEEEFVTLMEQGNRYLGRRGR